MRLDAQVLRYLSKDDFRVLTAIELGMRNHALVPTALIPRIASLSPSLTLRVIRVLHQHKLVYHERTSYDGFRLTYLGYDYLALHSLIERGQLSHLGHRVGVGKEADVYLATDAEGARVVVKLHRLGRVSFRRIKEKRDYLGQRKASSWLYLSRLAAQREWAFLQLLHANGFAVPAPIDHSRHVLLMAYVEAPPLSAVRQLQHPQRVYSQLMRTIVQLAEHGLIHSDYNEFNLLIHPQDEAVTLIDFPQVVSAHHPNARTYFERDVECVRSYFQKRFGYVGGEVPSWDEDVTVLVDLGLGVRASGSDVGEAERREFEKRMDDYNRRAHEEESAEEREEEDDEEEDVGDAIAEGDVALADENSVDTRSDSEADGAADEGKGAGAAEDDEQDAAFRARMLRKEQRQHEEKLRQQRRLGRKQFPQPSASPDTPPSQPVVQDATADEEHQPVEEEEEDLREASDLANAARDVQLVQHIKAQLQRGVGGRRGASDPVSRSRNRVKDRKATKLHADMHAQM